MQDRHHFLQARNNILLCQRSDKELDIAPTTKRPAIPGENHRPHLVVIPAFHQGFAQAGREFIVHYIELGRTVEGNGCNTAFTTPIDGFFHRVLLFLLCFLLSCSCLA